MNVSKSIEASNLCSRKLWQMLKNSEWQSQQERAAIEAELISREHYVREIEALGSATFRIFDQPNIDNPDADLCKNLSQQIAQQASARLDRPASFRV